MSMFAGFVNARLSTLVHGVKLFLRIQFGYLRSKVQFEGTDNQFLWSMCSLSLMKGHHLRHFEPKWFPDRALERLKVEFLDLPDFSMPPKGTLTTVTVSCAATYF